MIDMGNYGWLIAYGDETRVDVLRSTYLDDSDDDYRPVRGYLRDRGLVMAAQQTFDHDDWINWEVEWSVFVPAAVRSGVLAGTELSMPRVIPEEWIRKTEVYVNYVTN